jgi:hypothetical protein
MTQDELRGALEALPLPVEFGGKRALKWAILREREREARAVEAMLDSRPSFSEYVRAQFRAAYLAARRRP